MIFAFLFGLSMDYEVFILARMREEYDNTGSTRTAVIRGIGRTGRLVTSAALILFLAFTSMASAPETDVKMMATGLAAGILLDATVIRALIVPVIALMDAGTGGAEVARPGPARGAVAAAEDRSRARRGRLVGSGAWIEVAIGTAATLLERERELAALTKRSTMPRRASGRLVLVEAPAGLGKTALLTAGVEAAGETGFTTLRARASDLERDFAYGCVRQLLDPYVTRLPDDDHDRLFAGAPSLSESLFAPNTVGAPLSADRAFSMLHGLYWLVNNIADDTPALLYVDDLHWADTESLRFLNFLAPRLDGLAVAILCTARPGEPDAAELNRLAAAPESECCARVP